MATILGIVFLLISIGSLVYGIIKQNKIIKDHQPGKEYGFSNNQIVSLIYNLACTSITFVGAALCHVWARSFKMTFGTITAVTLGSLLFALSISFGIGAFRFFYYKTDLPEKNKKFCKIAWPICIVTALLGLWIYSEGIAVNPEIYPLISGLSFKTGWIRGDEYVEGFKIKLYGIFIVLGALLCYAITDHMTYQKFKKHGLVDTLFILAFLFGILGARLWYCIVLEPDIIRTFGFGYVFTGIADGGLAIQGGAILGILAGVTFMLVFRKYIDVRFMMDVAVPTILLAQVIGRWGNFFNQEVYGMVVSKEALWFVPTIVRENMFIDGAYRVPLFFIEGCINLCGYFFIRYFLGKVCKFHIGLGYQASFYLVWYGMVRAILELLRDARFKYMNSWYIAFGMMAGGLLLFLFFFLLHKFRKNKGLENEYGEKI